MSLLDYELAVPVEFGVGITSERAVAHHPHDLEGARRFLNVAVAALGLIIAAPLMALIAVAVKLTSPGPVFYRQTRVGLCPPASMGGNDRRCPESGGQLFTIYKFRTMQAVAPSAESQVWCGTNDPRITPVGHFLRRSRLDELPQLVNVLMGDMNVVGPRPEQPAIFVSLRKEVPGYSLRQRVRPGITGLAQVTLAYDTCVDDVRKKVAADLEYIANQSWLTDLGIMLRTVPVMVMRIGSR